jgi:isocitrate lyase
VPCRCDLETTNDRRNEMDNHEKFEEQKKIILECQENFLKAKPSVFDCEKMKYSDEPTIRRAAAIIEYADMLWTEKLLDKKANIIEEKNELLEKILSKINNHVENLSELSTYIKEQL